MSVTNAPPLADLDAVLAEIRARYRHMSPAHRKLADYVLEHPHHAAFFSAGRLGTAVELSAATVVRFAESLGLTGYAQLQSLAQEGLWHEVDTVAQLKRATPVAEGGSVLRDALYAEIANLEKTAELISEDSFAQAVRMLGKARVIHIVGLRSTYGIAHNFAFHLDMIGRSTSMLLPGLGDLPEQLLKVRRGDVCVVISFRRYTQQAIEILNTVKRLQMPIVAITDTVLSPLADAGDAALIAVVKFPSFFESHVAPLGVMNALVTSVALAARSTTLEALQAREHAWAEQGTYLNEGLGGQHASRVHAFEAIESFALPPQRQAGEASS